MEQNHSSSNLLSPLIRNPENGNENSENLIDVECCSHEKSQIISELKHQLCLACPLIIVSFLQYSLQMISVMFVGRLGELALASATMATSFAGVTGFSFMLGMGGALETLCGQAYGAKQYHMLGVHMQKAMVVLSLLCIPISLLWASIGHIFLFFKQDPQISLHAESYALWLIPSILPYGLLQCQLRFLQAQSIVTPLMITTAVTSLIHVIVCWILIFGFGLGNKGAALSIALSYWMNVAMLAVYIRFSSACKSTWTGFAKDGMRDLLGFLTLGIPSALMVCLEMWSYEFLVLMSGLLPHPKLETSMMSISLNTSAVVFRIPFGLGSAVSTRVSNELGAGKPHRARLAVKVVLFLGITEGMSLSLISVAMRDIWGYMYTNEDKVARYFASVMPVLATSNFMDGIQGVLSGVARGCGWQRIGALVNLGSYYLLGLPSAIILTFILHLGVKGLWMGIICGSASQALLLLAVTLHTNWEHEAVKARERVYAERIEVE